VSTNFSKKYAAPVSEYNNNNNKANVTIKIILPGECAVKVTLRLSYTALKFEHTFALIFYHFLNDMKF
jgi:hypothetical protein